MRSVWAAITALGVYVRGRRFVYYIDIFSAFDVRGCRDMVREGDLLFFFRAGHPSPGAVRARTKGVWIAPASDNDRARARHRGDMRVDDWERSYVA